MKPATAKNHFIIKTTVNSIKLCVISYYLVIIETICKFAAPRCIFYMGARTFGTVAEENNALRATNLILRLLSTREVCTKTALKLRQSNKFREV
jgi:hypothetical protein